MAILIFSKSDTIGANKYLGGNMKKFLALFCLSFVLVLLPVAALAAEFRSSQDTSISLDKSETAKNLYIAGNTVNVSGTAQGDLTAAGNTINLDGPVQDGLFAFGNNLNIDSSVGQNARVAGGNVNLNGDISGDFMAAGSIVSVGKDSVVSGDLIVGAGQVTIDGKVEGMARIAASDVTISGTINGNVDIYATKVIISNDAYIGGNLTYHAPEQATISSSAKIIGKTDFQKTEQQKFPAKEMSAVLGIFGVFGLLMGLALLFVLVYILPKTSKQLVEGSLTNFWANLGWGFIGIFIIPIGMMIVAFTFVGLKVAGVILVAYIAAMIIAAVAATLALGSQILRWFGEKQYRVDWLTILVGTLAVMILGVIPVVGGLVVFAFTLAVLGRVLVLTVQFIKSQR